MHQLINNHLEDYLREPGAATIPPDFHIHLAACSACAHETKLLESQSRLLRGALQVKNAELAPGFYARVMNRVEQREEDSIWSILLEPAIGRRLAIACGTLALLLGTYLASTERAEHVPASSGVVMSNDRNASFEDGTVQPRQRDAVLVNLVTFRE